ncbi:MAG TPA: alanine--tRNA ligase [Gemmataceae bacterium]
MPSANEIRQQFIDFFVQKHGHTFVPSSSVVPYDDPTLLFSNAGMNQFKDVFLGTGTRPYKRAVNTQKCIRAGGKHNDLEDVGKDTYHHTFFEMLGNWSFGDYFKKEAIRWAWELLTKEWRLDKSRLHATVFEGDDEQKLAPDDEAAALWRSETDIDPSHIHKGSKKDNFWEMGDTGPCGPCSEIHIDRTPDKRGGALVNKGAPDVIEIWNLVFIQFNRGPDGVLTPLPAKHVDTGMGFERICAVLQGKSSNYDTDVFAPIMDAIGKLTGKKYGGRLDDLHDIGFRVIADHLRMATFAITDGARPGNKKRDAVLRSVIRRAVRFGYQYFDLREPFVYKLVPVVVEQMGEAFPELKVSPERVQEIIRGEESDFLRTLERGLSLFNQACEDALTQFQIASFRAPGAGPKEVKPLNKAQMEHWEKYPKDKYPTPVIADTVVFNLHTTYGFPPDLTCQMAQERNLAVDMEGYRRLMREHEEKSRPKTPIGMVTTFYAMDEYPPATDDRPKWGGSTTEAKVLGWLIPDPDAQKSIFIKTGQLNQWQQVGLILDRTCFYHEAGGQVSDPEGFIITPTGKMHIFGIAKIGNTIVHTGCVTEGHIEVGQTAKVEVGSEREFIRKNHTATHLLNWALRKVLGEHVEQRGSLVDAEKTRFDFTHDKPLSLEEMDEIERLVNEKIYADLPVTPVVIPLAEAKNIPGVRAVFGEKYPDPVRVLLIGAKTPEEATLEASVEFCGGTHLDRTGQVGFFLIAKEEGVAKGVRRLTCKTARGAVQDVQKQLRLLMKVADQFNCKWEDLPVRVEVLQEEVKKLQTQLRKGAASDLAGAGDRLLAQAVEANGAKVIVGEMPPAPVEQMRQQLDRLREKAKSAVAVIGWADEGKVGLLSLVTDDLGKKGLHAGKLIGEVAKVVGGRGGGPATGIAQAGGKDAGKLGEALQLARKLAIERLSG